MSVSERNVKRYVDACRLGMSVVSAPIPPDAEKLRESGHLVRGHERLPLQERILPETEIERGYLEVANQIERKEKRFDWVRFPWDPEHRIRLDPLIIVLADFTDNHKIAVPEQYLPIEQIRSCIDRIAEHTLYTDEPLTQENLLKLAKTGDDHVWADIYVLALSIRRLGRDSDSRLGKDGLSIDQRLKIIERMTPAPIQSFRDYSHVEARADVVVGDNYHLPTMVALRTAVINHKRRLREENRLSPVYRAKFSICRKITDGSETLTHLLRGGKLRSGSHEEADNLGRNIAEKFERIANSV